MDWKRIDATTDAEITRQIADDPDTYPEIDDETLTAAELVRGAASPPPRVPVSLRVKPEVLAWYRTHGPGYQTYMHSVLEAFMRRRRERP